MKNKIPSDGKTPQQLSCFNVNEHVGDLLVVPVRAREPTKFA